MSRSVRDPDYRPYRIFSLIESCPTSQHEGVTTGRSGEMGAATKYVAGWLRANPGRWFLVGAVLDRHGDFIGVEHRGFRKFGFEVEVVNKNVYARLPDASGVPLDYLVTRHKPIGQGDKMPMLERDRFNWSLAELRTAASTAREWLGGATTYAAAA